MRAIKDTGRRLIANPMRDDGTHAGDHCSQAALSANPFGWAVG
jgi:hypothetical protein